VVPFILKADGVSLFPVGQAPIVIDGSHLNFKAVVEAIEAGDFDKAIELASVKNFIKATTSGKVEVTDEGVLYEGEVITGYLASKMVEFFNKGLPVQHYCKFLENLMSNPSMVSRKELYLFLEAANLPITEDGCFLAYKAVRHDFRDIHTGKFDNTPGQVLEMPRSKVDDDRNRTCSEGFHAAAYDYAKGFMGGGRMVAVKINPADVVSVPSDYDNQKLRTCRYEVLYEIAGAKDTLTGVTYVALEDIFGDDVDEVFMWGDPDNND
jgi:hypothetical protein